MASTPRPSARTAPLLEIAGLAGAGKTTLAHLLDGADPTRALGPVRVVAGLLPAVPSLALARLGASGRGWTADELRSLAYLGAWQRAVRRRTDPRPAVLDHGPVYRLASLSALGPPLMRTAAFRRHSDHRAEQWAALLDMVVWLEAPDDLLLERIDDRRREHRVRHRARAEAVAFLAGYRAAYDRVLESFERAGTDVLHLDSSRLTPEQLAHQVCAHLESRVGSR